MSSIYAIALLTLSAAAIVQYFINREMRRRLVRLEDPRRDVAVRHPQRMTQILRGMGWSKADIAEQFGVPQEQVDEWLRGGGLDA